MNRGTDQIVTGLMFNIFALGLTGTLHSLYLAGQNGETLTGIIIPGIGSLPWVGEILGRQSLMLYLAIAMAFGVWYLLNKTWYGLYARAAGELASRRESWAGSTSCGSVIPPSLSRSAFAALGGSGLLVLVYLGRLRTRHDRRPGLHRPGRGGARQMEAALDHDLALGFGLTEGLQFLAAQVPTLHRFPRSFGWPFPISSR